jgi:peroxiredoxin
MDGKKMKLYQISAIAVLAIAILLGVSAQADDKASATTKISAMKDKAVTVAALGKMAPDFTLVNAEGKKHSLSDYKGKYVVLEWVNYDCPFVKKHYHSDNMQSFQADYAKKDVVWLSICSSAPGKQGYFEGEELSKRIVAEKSKATEYLIDADGKVGRIYEAKTTPHMFIVDPEGNLVYAGGIDDKASTKMEDIKESNNFIVMALNEVLKGKKISNPVTAPYGCSVKY